MKGTEQHGLHLKPAVLGQPYTLGALCDADWASDIDDRRSTSGVAIYFRPSLISWWSHKQQVVARSSIEAEYRSLSQTAAEISCIQTLLTELKVSFSTPIVFYENQNAVAIAHNPVLHSQTKHMKIDVFFVRKKVLTRQLVVHHIPALDQWADALTRPLLPNRFMFLRAKLNVLETSSKSHPP